MSQPTNILLQTTIVSTDDDWHIGRFKLLRAFLEGLSGADGGPLFTVTARDRASQGQPDPIMANLDTSFYDQLWLFAVDTGDGLTDEDCAGISRFRQRGGALMVTRDHMDLGSSVCNLSDVGAAHYFHSKNTDPDPARRCNDDINTNGILWPNYHSGANGDYQEIRVAGKLHAVMIDPNAANGLIRYLPAHPHEGAVGAPPNDSSARVIATGRSKVTGKEFNIAIAFEPHDSIGPAIAQSTFHHFADYNWDIKRGAPSFVSEAPGDGMATFPEARRSTEQYMKNIALWLTCQSKPE